MKLTIFSAIMACIATSSFATQPPKISPPRSPDEKRIATQIVLGVTSVPYVMDLMWQVPLGSKISWATTSSQNPDPRLAKAKVFLLRGSGTMFSRGFGNICTKLRQSGIWAEDLGSAGESWMVNTLLENQKAGHLKGPIILVGHSRGGRHVLDAALKLQRAGITIDLLICLDVAAPTTVPGNVRQALNLYMSQRRIYPAEQLKAAPGSLTLIENVDLDAAASPLVIQGLNHLNITANTSVQEFVIRKIEKVVDEMAQPR